MPDNPRAFDAEIKLLNWVSVSAESTSQGKLYLTATEIMCPSCESVSWQFRAAHPGITLDAVSSSTSLLRTGTIAAPAPIALPLEEPAAAPILEIQVSW
jgi:hypothetical protein